MDSRRERTVETLRANPWEQSSDELRRLIGYAGKILTDPAITDPELDLLARVARNRAFDVLNDRALRRKLAASPPPPRPVLPLLGPLLFTTETAIAKARAARGEAA